MARNEVLYKFLGLLGKWSDGKSPLYISLANAIELCIRKNELVPGDKLPSERDIADHLKVSRTTVINAMLRLKEQNLIISKQGSGYIVFGEDEPIKKFTPISRITSRLSPNGKVKSENIVNMTITVPEPPKELRKTILAGIDMVFTQRDYHSSGLPDLRNFIAEYYTKMGLNTSQEQIIITTGAQQAIYIAALANISRGDRVLIEDPTYYGAIDAYNLCGAKLISVPAQSVTDTVELEQLIKSTSPRIMHISPTHQNPTGAVLNQHSRAQLAKLSDKTDILIIEDDTMRDLWFENIPPPPIAYWSKKKRVISIGSFSKTIWGGLRIGWMRVAKDDVIKYANIKATIDLGTGFLDQNAVLSLNDAIEPIIRRTADLNKKRCDFLSSLVQEKIPDWHFIKPTGGAFLWVKMPGTDASMFQQKALRNGVFVTDGNVLSPNFIRQNKIRLSFSQTEEQLVEGVKLLRKTWEEIHSEKE